MANVDVTQAEADALLAMEKSKIDDQAWDYPAPWGRICVPLVSRDRRESFLLDVSRSGKIVLKGKYQNRARHTLILARYDFGGGPHRNPDGTEVDCPHLHLYREGYGDKWAYPAPSEAFANTSDDWQVLTDFMRFCNITEPPVINKVLFI
ncbi:MAG: hypothetical protein Q7T82_00390 [Armatimonadota bacterium]|nr:hypothetical protein [Armatimonadota bacterium]